MVRLVRDENGRVRVDRMQRAAGRGAYVCPTPSCAVAALGKGRLGRAFRRPSEPTASLVREIQDILG